MGEPASYDYVGAVNPSLECAICRTAFVSPVMSPVCQHIFCHLCVVRAIELSPTCPIDRSPLQLDDLLQAPRIIQQMVEELKVSCSNAALGCQVQCERGLLEGHLREECSARRREDLKGKGKVVAEDGDATEESPEQDGWARCELCDAELLTSAFEAHTLSCPSAAITCRYCQTTLLRSAIPSHNLACPSIPIPCPHAHHGCSARVPRSAMLEDHLEVSCAYEPVKDYLDRQEARLVEVEGENKMLATRCAGLEDGMREMRGVLEGIRRGMGGFYVEPWRESVTVEGGGAEEQPSVPPSAVDDLAWPAEEPAPAHPSSSTIRAPTRSSTLPPAQLRSPPSSAPLPLTELHVVDASGEHYPFPQPTSPLPFASTSIDATSQPLNDVLSTLRGSIASLSSALASLEARQSANLMNETLRMQDDVQSVRAAVHGMRMQMHYLLMEVGRVTGGGVGAPRSAVGAGMEVQVPGTAWRVRPMMSRVMEGSR